MRHITINLNKDDVTQLRRGGKIDYYYNGTAVRVEIIGPKNDEKPRRTASSNFQTPMKLNPRGHGSI